MLLQSTLAASLMSMAVAQADEALGNGIIGDITWSNGICYIPVGGEAKPRVSKLPKAYCEALSTLEGMYVGVITDPDSGDIQK